MKWKSTFNSFNKPQLEVVDMHSTFWKKMPMLKFCPELCSKLILLAYLVLICRTPILHRRVLI